MAPKTGFITGTSGGSGAKDPRRRVFPGDGPFAIAPADDESRLATWRHWEPLSVAAHGHADLTG